MISYRQVFKAGAQSKEFHEEILHNYVKVQESFFFLIFITMYRLKSICPIF